MTVSLLWFILLRNTAVSTTAPPLQCIEATSTIPSANYKMAVGSNNDNLFLIGGIIEGTYFGTKSIISKSKRDILNNTVWSSSTTDSTVINGESQFWTQQQDVVYMVTEPYRADLNVLTAPYISTYDMTNEILSIQWNDITLPTKMRGCVASSSDYLYFVGGYDPQQRDYMTEKAYFNTVLMFHLLRYTWATAPSMNQRRRGHSCIVHNNKLWAIGGKNASSTFHLVNAYHKSIERISVNDIKKNTWGPPASALNSLTVGASGLRSVGYNEYIFVFGGLYDYNIGAKFKVLDTVHIIDTNLDVVRLSPTRLPYPVWAAATIIVSDTIYVFGGNIEKGAATVTDKWIHCTLTTATTEMPSIEPITTTQPPTATPSADPTTHTTTETFVPSTASTSTTSVVPCTTSAKIDYIFAVDVSGSIGKDAFEQERQWLSDVFERGDLLSSDARVGWTIFDTNVITSDIALKEWSADQLVSYVKGIRYTGGATDTAGALKAILTEFSKNGMDSREKVVIMTTDGKPYKNGKTQDVCTPYASVIKEEDIRLIVLGVGADMTPSYVSCLLEDVDTDYIPVTSFNVDDFNQILPQLQEIACPPVVPCATAAKVDYIFAVDASGSIGKEAFQDEKTWLADVFKRGDILSSDARVGWTIFDTNVNISDIVLKEWTTEELVNYVKNIRYAGGSTDTAGALKAILTEFGANGITSREKVVIMTTDGKPYKNGNSQDVCTPYQSVIKEAGIRLIVLAVGSNITPEYITCLLTKPDSDYIPVNSFDVEDFNKILPQLQEVACPDDAPVAPCTSTVKIDYIFAVDASGSIGNSAFQEEKNWLSDVFEMGEILSGDARVGWTIFATNVNTSDISLKKWTTEELMNYVTGIRYTGGWTDTAGALQAILAEFSANGMDSREKVVIMTTDGKPYKNGNTQNVCTKYPALIKQAGIRVIVLAVGPSITPNYVSCLMEDRDTDYIPVTSFNVDDFNEILPQLKEIACPNRTNATYLHSSLMQSGASSDSVAIPFYGWLAVIAAALLFIGCVAFGILSMRKKAKQTAEPYVSLLDDDEWDPVDPQVKAEDARL